MSLHCVSSLIFLGHERSQQASCFTQFFDIFFSLSKQEEESDLERINEKTMRLPLVVLHTGERNKTAILSNIKKQEN